MRVNRRVRKQRWFIGLFVLLQSSCVLADVKPNSSPDHGEKPIELGSSASPAEHAAILATCFDYIDGQLEGDPERVARALHPDLAKRAAIGETNYERFALRRMSKEELVGLSKQGVLKTPKKDWSRSCKVLDVMHSAASVRLETPWFVDYFHMGQFGDKWLIVDALWYSKPAQNAARAAATEK